MDINLLPPEPLASSRRSRAFFLELLKVTVLALAIVLPIRFFIVQPYIVRGASMEPSLHTREYLIVDKVSYNFNEPARGEIVVFTESQLDEHLIKRVIGLPGERIEVKENIVTVYNTGNPDGFIVYETYLGDGAVTSGDTQVTLGERQYFVMGDNRANSYDSRYFGPIDAAAISGRAWVRLLPLGKMGIFRAPQFIE
jgi:signal peptidase I